MSEQPEQQVQQRQNRHREAVHRHVVASNQNDIPGVSRDNGAGNDGPRVLAPEREPTAPWRPLSAVALPCSAPPPDHDPGQPRQHEMEREGRDVYQAAPVLMEAAAGFCVERVGQRVSKCRVPPGEIDGERARIHSGGNQRGRHPPSLFPGQARTTTPPAARWPPRRTPRVASTWRRAA